MTEHIQSNATEPKYTKAEVLDKIDKIRDEVLEYIDDMDIIAEILDIFDKYWTEVNNDE